MFQSSDYKMGLEVEHLELCEFDQLDKLDNEIVIKKGRGKVDERMLRFITGKMGIESRYWAKKNQDAYLLASQALEKLLKVDPNLLDEAEFLIYGGISSPLPTVCTAALLASDYGLKNVSCWDLKSGCSTGVFALFQALDWFDRGAKKGIIICSETFSKFTNNEILQMSVSTGDGACALSLKASSKVKVLGAVHGTDAEYFKTMFVPGKYPIDIESYNPIDYTFHFQEKSDVLEKLAYYWQKSLEDLLEISGVKGSQINHYISHQVDGSKNFKFARSFDIPEDSIAQNFKNYGNMGCPTIFVNQYFWRKSGKKLAVGERVIFHAVGGGLSWAGLCLEKRT